MPRTYYFRKDVEGERYLRVLRILLSECAQFGLVWQYSFRFEPSAHEVEKDLLPLKVRSRRTACWPGTQLFEKEAFLRIYRCTSDAEAVLARPGSLFSWLQPRYPEDLCFFDATGAVLFASVAHEREAWFISRRVVSQIGQIIKLEREDYPLIGCDGFSYGSVTEHTDSALR